MARIIQGTQQALERTETGLLSLDVCLSKLHREDADSMPYTIEKDFGYPQRSISEFYGDSGSGKSTLSYYVSGAMAQAEESSILLADLEGLDLDYLSSAFRYYPGEVELIDRVDPDKPQIMRHHEDMAEDIWGKLTYNDERRSVIWDSVSATMSLREMEGTMGEANMGKRAQLIHQMNRRALQFMNASDPARTWFWINHKYQKLGSRGHVTAGGQSMQDKTSVRLWLWRKMNGKLTDPEEGDNYIISGRVMKNKHAGEGRQFEVVLLAGIGISQELTVLNDLINLGALTNAGGWVKEAGKKKALGRRTEFIRSTLAGDVTWYDDIAPIAEVWKMEFIR
jgi:RecA/RadA recombinase